MGLVLVDTLILYYPSLILFLKHKFMVYPGFCASVLVQWTCCPGAVNCNCCWVMLSPCPAPSLVGFFNFDIDTTMNTQHKLHISEWSGFCDQTSQFESAKTKYKHLSQILHSSVSMNKLRNAILLPLFREWRYAVSSCPLSSHTPHPRHFGVEIHMISWDQYTNIRNIEDVLFIFYTFLEITIRHDRSRLDP